MQHQGPPSAAHFLAESAYFEIVTAQRLLNGGGTFDTVVAKAVDGTSEEVLALPRAIGATRRNVLCTILAEAALVGAATSAAGLLLRVGMAHGLVALMNAFGLSMPRRPLSGSPGCASPWAECWRSVASGR